VPAFFSPRQAYNLYPSLQEELGNIGWILPSADLSGLNYAG